MRFPSEILSNVGLPHARPYFNNMTDDDDCNVHDNEGDDDDEDGNGVCDEDEKKIKSIS